MTATTMKTPSLGVSRASVWRRRALMTVGALAFFGACGVAMDQAGYRFNVSPSEPMGVWKEVPAGTIKRGDMVSVCVPPDAPEISIAKSRNYILPGSCPGNLAPLVKSVAAVAGDTVTISTTGVLVNGAFVSHTGPATRDSAGRPLQPVPYGIYTVPAGAIFLLSEYSPKSFDSRYFGFVPASGIRNGIKPVLVSDWKPRGY